MLGRIFHDLFPRPKSSSSKAGGTGKMTTHKVKKFREKSAFWFLGSGRTRLQEEKDGKISSPKNNKPVSRLWMRFSASGEYELLQLDRNGIMKLASVSARDLRILGPVSSESCYILARERIMIVNLEFIKAIVTAEDVFLLDPTSSLVSPFVNNLRQQFPSKDFAPPPIAQIKEEQEFVDETLCEDIPLLELDNGDWGRAGTAAVDEDIPPEFPFEFKVLECALDVVCGSLATKVTILETKAYPILDEFLRDVNSSSLESLRDELEELLNDDDDMAELYLTRKLTQDPTVASSVSYVPNEGPFTASKSKKGQRFHAAMSMATSVGQGGTGVDVLEMLLEVYFMELDATLNKLTTLREYITDTEDYINIQLDHQRNHLFQFHVLISVWSLAIAVGMGLLGACSMNIHIPAYTNGQVFLPFVLTTLGVCITIIVGAVSYFHWTGLFEW